MTSPGDVLELASLCRLESEKSGLSSYLWFVSVCFDTTSQHSLPSAGMNAGTYLSAVCDVLL